MKLLMVTEGEKEYRLFLEAWEDFTRLVNLSNLPQQTKSDIGTVTIKGIFYLNNNGAQPSDIYSLELLQSQHAKLNQDGRRAPRAVYDYMFVLGQMPTKEMIHFTRAVKYKMINRIMVIDSTMTNSQKEMAALYYPMITYGQFCQNPSYDSNGLVKDLVMFFLGKSGLEKLYPQPEQRIS